MRIWRYELEIIDLQHIDLPLSGRFLSVAPGRPVPEVIGWAHHIDLWATVPEVAPKLQTAIRIIGTGNPIPEGLEYRLDFIGTAVMPNQLVWHVFHEREPR